MIQMLDGYQQVNVEITKENSNNCCNRVLMIDLENCPGQINQLMDNLQSYSHVVVCYAQSGAKVPLDWVVPFTTAVNNDTLKIVKMPNVGKNAADFGITFWAGVLMAQLPLKSHIDIVSNDADLDHVVSLLRSQQCSAERISNKKDSYQSDSMTAEIIKKFSEDHLQEYCLHLLRHSKPAKKATLLNSIKSRFKENNDPEGLFEALLSYGIIYVKDEKISYNQQKLIKFTGL